MTNKPKTPGEVAWEAYISTLVKTPAGYGPANGGYTSPAWEAAAQAVRKQVGEEIRAVQDMGTGAVTSAIMESRKVRDIRAILREWHAQTPKPMGEWVFHSAQDVVETIEDLLDPSPMPEAEAECAEAAGAKPIPSPPPAER